jgi:hypothetical protein
MICPKCRKTIENGVFCPEDGAKLIDEKEIILKCTKCGRVYADGTKFCLDDGSPVKDNLLIAEECARDARVDSLLSGSSRTWWQNRFDVFRKQNGAFVFTWNWPAFFFGVIWYLVKGMTKKAAIYFATLVIVSVATAGAGVLLSFIVLPILSSYDYYLYMVESKELW